MRAWRSWLHKMLADKRGSDTIEMILSIATISCFIVLCISIMTYVIFLGQINFQTKHMVREIEVTGILPSETELTDEMRNAFSSTSSLTNITVAISDAERLGGSEKLQFCGTFKVTTSCSYDIPIITPGAFDEYTIHMPISTTVSGMSEVYLGQ